VQCTRRKRRTATIAPLVVLRVARSGTPPLQRPLRGSLGGSPAPGLLRPGDVFHVFKHWQCALSQKYFQRFGRPFQAVDHLHHHEDPSMRIVEGGGEASMSAWRLLNATAVSFSCKQLVVECVQCFANRL
jgi:hypothetical protein